MRAFIAINLADNVKLYLYDLQNKLLKETQRISIAKNCHLTLKFLGNIDDNLLKIVRESLFHVKFKRFSFRLGMHGVFPSRKVISVIWMGITPELEVIKLQSLIDMSLMNYFPKEKKFKPHITLARVKSIGNAEAFLKEADKLQIKNFETNVEDFRLVKSTLTKQGAMYEDIETYPL